MAIRAAMVDRARVVGKVSTGRKVRGTTQMAPTEGAWFRARLTLPAAPEDVDATHSRVRTVARPELLFDIKDTDGEPLELTNEQKLEVDSAELGRTVWQVTTDPRPIRKKRRIIGYTVELVQVQEHEATLA